MERKPDWEDQLHLYLESVAAKPHAYGTHDCMTFCAGCIKALTGVDLAKGHRRKYATASASVRHLKKRGFTSPEEMIDSLLPERPVGFARRGDIVLADGIPGVCWGEIGLFIGSNTERVGLFPVGRVGWSKAWSVGE